MEKTRRFLGLLLAAGLLLATNAYADSGTGRQADVLPDPEPPVQQTEAPSDQGDTPLAVTAGENVTATDAVITIPEDGGDQAVILKGTFPSLSLVNVEATAGGEGVLSTEGSRDASVAVIDSTLVVAPDSAASGAALLGYEQDAAGSGYGAYCGSSSEHYYHGVRFTGATYGAVLDGAESVWFGSSTGTIPLYDAVGSLTGTARGQGNTTNIDGVFGLLLLGGAAQTVTVDEGTAIHTRDAAVLYKGGGGTLRFNNARITADNGVLLQMMDDDGDERLDGPTGLYDERDVGGAEGFPGIGFDSAPAADPSEDPSLPPAASGEWLTAVYTNGLYRGDIYNGTGYYGQPGDSLDLTVGHGAVLFGDVALTSTIKAIPYRPEVMDILADTDGVRYVLLDSQGAPCQEDSAAYIQFTAYTAGQRYLQGHVQNMPYSNGCSALEVTVAEGGVWVVEETSLVSRLTVERGGTVYGAVCPNIDGTVSLSPSREKLEPGVYEPKDPKPSPTPEPTATPEPEETPEPTPVSEPEQGADVLEPEETASPSPSAAPEQSAATQEPEETSEPTPVSGPERDTDAREPVAATPAPRRRAVRWSEDEVTYT